MALRRPELLAAAGRPCPVFACDVLSKNSSLAEKKKCQVKFNKDVFYMHKIKDANDILLSKVFFCQRRRPGESTSSCIDLL